MKRSDPMPVKYWSSAGLLVTDWCNARCASCYLGCGPERHAEMSIDNALSWWRGLIEASPHGCRVHLSGGEPFGNYSRLIEICLRARREKLAPLEKVETNAFWAVEENQVRRRLVELDRAGMGKMSISADPYHQQFVPIERCRLLARISAEVLGSDRVQVRWRDWLEEGFDTDAMDPADRAALFERYAAAGRDRYNGRAAELPVKHIQHKPHEEFADNSCRKPLLRSRHVHIDPAGRVMPGVCAGIILGVLVDGDVAGLWKRLDEDHGSRAIVATLADAGPAGLLKEALDGGYEIRDGYAGKCHLCWDVRRHFVRSGMHLDELGPAWLYGTAAD